MAFAETIAVGTRVLVPEHGKRRGAERVWTAGTVTDAAAVLTVALDDGRTAHVPRGLVAPERETETAKDAEAFALVRVASGDYETRDGAVRVWRVPDVNPPAWNAERVTDGAALVDGARTLADAAALAADALAEIATEGKAAALTFADGAAASTAPEAETVAEAYARGMLDARRIGLPEGMRDADGIAYARGRGYDDRESRTQRAYWYGAARGLREARGRRAAEAVGRFIRLGSLAAASRLVARYGYSVTHEAARTEDGPTYSVARALPNGGTALVDVGWMDSVSALVAALYRAEAIATAEADADALAELETWRRMIAPETARWDGATIGPPDDMALAAAFDAARAIVRGDAGEAIREAAASARHMLAGMDAHEAREAEPLPTVLPSKYRAAVIAALAFAAGEYARPDEEGGPLRALDALGGAFGETVRAGIAERVAEREHEARGIGEARIALRAALAALDARELDRAARYAYSAAQYAETAHEARGL